mmetsp:Transcript_124921/g.233596  ORF Transcript_124921/g.233596 Transcript_124921/m.233596 type:complete len:367 (+) Transcript_124921:79-1179(+)
MGLLSGTAGLIFGAAGIYGAFMYYGYLQEDVFLFEDASGQKFTQVWFLQAIEALANVIIGFIGMKVTGRTLGLPLKFFAMSGTTQVAAKACMSSALAVGLSFPVATLAKSAKMAPVMLGGILIGGKKYPLRQYLQVAAIIAGTVMVSMKSKSGGKASSLLGVIYICSSLAFDGLTGGVQDRLKTKSKEMGLKAKPYDFMFWSNFFMFLVALGVSLVLGQAFTGLFFIASNPEILSKVLVFAACSAIGQSFIFFVIAEFGALKCATVTTTRKIFSVLLSIFAKGHALSPLGWMGILVGSAGIIGELIPEKKQEQSARVPVVPAAAEAREPLAQAKTEMAPADSFSTAAPPTDAAANMSRQVSAEEKC